MSLLEAVGLYVLGFVLGLTFRRWRLAREKRLEDMTTEELDVWMQQRVQGR